MVIRTREEALKALSEILHLDRRAQIVESTVRLAQCLTPAARQILFRAQEGIVNGNLKTRLQELAQTAPVDEEEASGKKKPLDERRLEAEIAMALEALKAAAVAFDVFPSLGGSFARWEVARVALNMVEDFRRLIADGTDPAKAPAAEKELTALVHQYRPWWHSETLKIEEACAAVVRNAPKSRWRPGSRSLLDVIAATELRAMYAVKDVIPNQQAMIEPLSKILVATQRILEKIYPQGIPDESALRE